MKKNYLSLLLFLFALSSGFGQVLIDQLNFETAGGYTTSVAEFTDNNEDYFVRTDGTSNINGTQMVFTNRQGTYFFAAHDTNGDGGPNTLTLDFNGINISGYTSLELRIHLAEDDDGGNQDWDGDSYVHISGSIDSGTSENLLWIEAAGGTNTEPRVDTDFNGTGDGTAITDDFTQFISNISGTGSNLDIEIEINDLNDGDEDIAIDNIEIWGVALCTDAVDFERLLSPTVSPDTITEGDSFVVSTIAVEPGVTDLPGEAVGIEAWIGYSTVDNDPSTSPGWTWIPATYTGDVGANDIHAADIGTGLTPGTYYYASRHRLNGCGYTYGGDVNAITFWNNDSQVLIVNTLPPADVVITEIMYNSSGNDDEWIEICNVSGSTQILNNHTIEIGGTLAFTFPSTGATINDGDCIIIDLGDGSNASYNIDCPISVLDYSNGSGNGTLNNSSDTIELIASDGTTTVDIVTYDDGDSSLTDNNGASYHIIDTALDNSVTSSNWWPVINGGSPGINSLISPCTPVGPEINLEGTTANFPDISDGDVTPAGFDGTDFGSVTVGGTSTNTFRIENFGGTQDLTISSVTVFSGDTGDFSISSLPSSPIAAIDFSLFDIEFSPTAIGARTVVIEIRSNDSDEDPYTFTVTGNGLCAASAITAEPSSGPVGTVVTVTGVNLSAATASFNGLAATVNNISATVMEVTVPSGASTGNLEITDDLGCPGTTPFTVIESQISSCEGSSGTTPTDLFISEVTDANTGGLTYIEIYNGTGATVNLSGYSIQFFNNGNATENGGLINLNNTNLATGNTYVVAVSTGSNCTGITGADGSLADQTGFGGVNFGVNSDDHIRLYDGTTHLDSWGEYLSNTWADALGIGSEGVVFTRNNNAGSLPNTTFNIADWTYVDWTACADNDYSNIGTYDFSTGTPPLVTSISDDSTACNESTITVTASEGFAGGNALEYIWHLYNPAQSGLGWQVISNGGIYTTSNSSPSLVISDAASVIDYQFYCEVREDDSSCSSASNAIQITVSTATWDGTNWTWNDGTALNTLPTTSANVVIDGDYDTSVGGFEISFEACECIINTASTLNIENNTYVLVENDLTVDGNVVLKTDGSFVQTNDAGIVDGDVLTDKTKISVEKETSPLASFREYTYWSSPVVGEVISDGLFEADANRIYSFNGENFRDSFQETNNDNSAVAGQDDIDDDANDWQFANAPTVMLPGVGYASTHSPTGFVPARYLYTFEGAFNNGVFNIPIYRNDAELNDNNWNFIGNPYPSAIDADLFLAANASIDQTVGATSGAIFFWSHNTVADGNTNGNEELNYSQSDYAIINGSGETAGGDGVTPTRHIPSGQGFFISMDDAATASVHSGTIMTTDIVFNNSMRITGNNNQFFRNTTEYNKLWLNLTSDNGVFNQALIAYVDGATDGDDGMYYDAYKNLSTDLYSGIYSTLNASSDKKFAIQGKDPNSLDINEVIYLGFSTTIEEATIYTISIHDIDGLFMDQNDIFIIDFDLNTIHNLKTANYNFTSSEGEFNNRFKIVFNAQALSIDENIVDTNALTINELSNGNVQIKISKPHTIRNVEILDVMGRVIYNLEGTNSVEVYNLSKLSKAAYIAKVTLSNGQVISKKAIKQK